MLIQITNRCHEGCPHCLQDSSPNGGMMDFATFKKTLQFGEFLGCPVYIISGGEPTEHPQFLEFCQYLDKFISKSKVRAVFSITSNGAWFPEKVEMVKKLARLKNYASMQVYTNRKWYKNADFIIAHKEEINAIPKCEVDTTDIRGMQDLGRAKQCREAQAEVAASPYHMSCLNSHLLFRQISPTRRLNGVYSLNTMCKPMVDYNGNVHLSESWLCPSFGNVNTDLMMGIFNQLRTANPCYGCALGKKFLESTKPDIVMAREMLSK